MSDHEIAETNETEEISAESLVPEGKKRKKFHAKEFRQQLNSTNALNAVKEFVQLCTHSLNHDYALDYLEHGGTCSEFIYLIEKSENKSASHNLPILEALTIILLKIISNYTQKQQNAEEACKDLMNKHHNILKNTLNLSSNSVQKKVGLKLFTTMVTLNSKFAKDILTQFYFDESLLQILTAPSNNSLRTSFIHFLISFLIEGNIDTIQMILKKQHLLQSIFPALIYDNLEIIEIFFSTLQTNILENVDLKSKTVKMNIFSQKTIQNIINLYDWRGPTNYNPKKKYIKISVDSAQKTQVCDLVHNFLLLLCTNKKYGITFHDENLGLTNSKHNSLLTNVVKSLNKPWNNKYTADLVVNICTSSPDIIKHVLIDIQPSLEIRESQNWSNVVQFIKQIIQDVNSENFDKYLHKFNQKQLFSLIQIFSVPQTLLKICNEGILHENIGIRHQILLLLSVMLNSLNNIVKIITNNLEINVDNKKMLKESLTNYLTKNLPPVSSLLDNCQKFETNSDSLIPFPDYNSHLTLILDILYKYKLICPEIIDNTTQNTNIFTEILQIDDAQIFTKATMLFVSVDNSLFHPSNEMVAMVFPRLLHLFYTTKNTEIQEILTQILTISGVFEGCDYEIYILLSSILDFESLDNSFATFLVQILRNTSENFLQYNNELSNLKSNQQIDTFNLKNWLNKEKTNEITIKHKSLSPFIIGLLKSENSEYINKLVIYLLFSQSEPKILQSLLLQNKNLLNKNLINFCKTFENINSLKKILNENTNFYKIFTFLTSTEPDFILESLEPHSVVSIINFTIYFYTENIINNQVTPDIQNKCLKIITNIINKTNDKQLLKTCLNSIFKHPVLLQSFLQQTNDCTSFIVKIIEHLLTLETKDSLEPYLDCFRTKLVKNFCKNYDKNFLDLLNIFEINFEQSKQLITIISQDFEKINNYADILSYIFNMNVKNFDIFDDQIVLNISKIVEKTSFETLENSFCNYILKFPHLNKVFDENFFEKLILKPVCHKSTTSLCQILLKYNPKFIDVFERNLDTILENRELVFSLLNVVNNENTALEQVYNKYEPIILKFINKPQKIANYLIENYLVIVKLIQKYMSVENCSNIVSKIQKYDVTEIYHTEVLICIYTKSIINEPNVEKKYKFISNFICTFMNLLTNILKREKIDFHKTNTICKNINIFLIKIKSVYKLKFNDESIYKNAFLNFSKLCLKYGIQNSEELLQTLKLICQFSKSQNDDFSQIFEMAISHSESLNILLAPNLKKATYLSLLLTLLKNNKTMVQKNHIPVFLGSYTATLSISDQYILSILSIYEAANIGFHEYKPYLFSQSAIQFYSLESGIVNNLWRQPKPQDVLDIFDEEKIRKTVDNFPVSRKLRPGKNLYCVSELDVYDPSFYLPLLSQILAPESPIRWYHITQRSIICLVLISLSSKCREVRAAAAHVLSRFHHHLEAAQHAKQRLLWTHLIEFICRGTSMLQHCKLSSVVALFLCRVATVLTRPADVLYKPLGNYIMSMECPNFTIVPELLEMLFNTNVLYKTHKVFILRVLRDGIRTKDDLEVVFRSLTFKLILDFYNSTLSSFENKKLILEIISSTVQIPHGSQILLNNYSMLSWLETISQTIEPDLFESFICLINNLVTPMPRQRLKRYRFKILLILVSAVNILNQSKINLEYIVKFVKILYIVYEKRPDILNNNQLQILIKCASKFINCNLCNYYLQFGIEFIEKPQLKSEENCELLKYYLELLTIKWIETNM